MLTSRLPRHQRLAAASARVFVAPLAVRQCTQGDLTPSALLLTLTPFLSDLLIDVTQGGHSFFPRRAPDPVPQPQFTGNIRLNLL